MDLELILTLDESLKDCTHSQDLISNLRLLLNSSQKSTDQVKFVLKCRQGILGLYSEEFDFFYLDFDQQIEYRRKNDLGKKDLLFKALGFRHLPFKVLDLTAGLLVDSWFMSQHGIEVVAVERHPIVFLLIQDALVRSEKKGSLKLIHMPAEQYLTTAKESFSAIYFDPMFPQNPKKKSLPRKQMQIFRQLVGPDLDAQSVLSCALNLDGKSSVVTDRVVLKRPDKSVLKDGMDDIILKNWMHSYKGTSIQFDVYRPSKIVK